MIRYIVGTKEKGNLFKDNRTYKSKSTALKARSRAYLTVNESLDILEIDVESDKEKILRLEQELQKAQEEINSLRSAYKNNIDSLSAGLSEDLLKILKTYPTALPYICEIKQELQKTREQLDKVEELLRTVIESAESLMTLGDRYTEHGQNIVDARQYFIDKDKQGE